MKRRHTDIVAGEVLSIAELAAWGRSIVNGDELLRSPVARAHWHDFEHGKTARKKFYGGERAAQAIKNLTVGRPDLLAKVKMTEVKEVQDRVRAKVPSRAYDVVGSSVSVPRVLAGHPLSMRRTKQAEGGLCRVVIDLGVAVSVPSDFRTEYILTGLAVAQALAMRGPTELYVCKPAQKKASYHDQNPMTKENPVVVTLIPIGLAPWHMAQLCGLATSGVLRGLLFARVFENSYRHDLVEMDPCLPLYRGQIDDLLCHVFPDWDPTRSCYLPKITQPDHNQALQERLNPAQWAQKKLVVGSALT